MNQKTINQLKRNYLMRKDEYKTFIQLTQMQKGDEMTVPTTPWIDKMAVYRKGDSVKAFILVRRDLYNCTFRPNPILF